MHPKLHRRSTSAEILARMTPVNALWGLSCTPNSRKGVHAKVAIHVTTFLTWRNLITAAKDHQSSKPPRQLRDAYSSSAYRSSRAALLPIGAGGVRGVPRAKWSPQWINKAASGSARRWHWRRAAPSRRARSGASPSTPAPSLSAYLPWWPTPLPGTGEKTPLFLETFVFGGIVNSW
jgi:hypothetical protein